MHTENLSARHRVEALRAIRNHKYEATEAGIEIASMGLDFIGGFEVAGVDGVWDIAPNIVVAEGRTHILDVALSQATQNLAFYIAPFSANVAVADNWTAATWVGLASEFVNYSETSRVAWTEAGAAAGSISNTASPALFTIGVGGGTVRGFALVSASVKSATTGVLIAASRLATDKVMAGAEELRVRYTMNVTSS